MGSDTEYEATRRLAHDLRNVLVSLQSVASAIERVLTPRDAALAGQLAAVVERAASLSRQMADGDDRPASERQCCALADVLLRSRPLLERVAAPVPLDLRVDLDERDGVVHLSDEGLERIAINLVRNARRASGSVGAIEVTVHRSVVDGGGEWDTLTVDNPDPRPRVARSWTRIEGEDIRPGLGLTIVGELVASAGGRLELWRSTSDVVRVVCVFPVHRGGHAREA